MEETVQLESFLEKRPEAEIVYIAGYKKQFKPGEDSSMHTFIVKHNKEDAGVIDIIN